MDASLRSLLWSQFGAAIDMLENAAVACPEQQWSDGTPSSGPWYLVYHTLFFLDLYLHGSIEGFHPPTPFGLEELDPRGSLPERPYTKAELLGYLDHCREKCQKTIAALDDEAADRRCVFGWGEASFLELLIYNIRHVQHGAAQLNLILRQAGEAAPRWVAQAKEES